MKLEELVSGREAADIMGFSRGDDVWRAVKRHAGSYPGRIDLVQIGRAYGVQREQMKAFARWYEDNIRTGGKMEREASPRTTRAAVADPMEKRRASLRAAIGRITARQEEEGELW